MTKPKEELCKCGHLRASHYTYTAQKPTCIGNRNLCRCKSFELQPPSTDNQPECTCGASKHPVSEPQCSDNTIEHIYHKPDCKGYPRADNQASELDEILEHAYTMGRNDAILGVDDHATIMPKMKLKANALLREARIDEVHRAEQGTDTEVSGLSKHEYFRRRYSELRKQSKGDSNAKV